MTDALHLVEVGPRDGLQNEAGWIPTAAKIAFVEALVAAGVREIEVSSFVSPKWVPQLADAEAVFAGIRRVPGVVYMALVPNLQGLERAHAVRAGKVAVFTAASETFSQKNTNASIAETLERFRPVVAAAGVPVRGYVSTAFHCPYEGPVAPEAAVAVAEALLALGCSEISIGDTIGKAMPDEVHRLLDRLLAVVPAAQVALHLHDTFGTAVQNVAAGWDRGIRTFDASAGGLGGCPYAPGAPGNLATETLLQAYGAGTGIDPEAIRAAAASLRSARRDAAGPS